MAVELFDTDTKSETFYTLVYADRSPVTGDVHEMINLFVEAEPVAVYLLTPDGESTPVQFHEVSGRDGTLWEIVPADEEDNLIEYVLYADEARQQYEERRVYVQGWPTGTG